MKKILQLCDSPFLTARASNAIQFSVFQTLGERFDAWLCGEYINVRYKPDDKVLCDFYNKDFWFSDAKMFSRQSLLFTKETLSNKSVDILKFIRSSIDEGKYITGDYNAFYISDTVEYKILNRRETYLIYGYDSTEELLYIYGNTVNGLSRHTITFSEYYDSITNRDDGMFNLNIMGLNPDFEFEFSAEKMKKQLAYYLHSQAEDSFYDITPLVFGINAIKKYKEALLFDFGIGRVITDNSLVTLYEHKKLMLRRVEYLLNHTCLDVRNLRNDFRNLCNIAEDILKKRNEYIQYNKPELYQQILNSIDELIKFDTEACSELLKLM